MSDSFWSHGPQHARPPYPSPTPRVYSNSCPLSRWRHPATSSSVVPFSSCPQSFTASVQFSSVQSLSHVQFFATPWTTACQASLSITNSQSLPQLMSTGRRQWQPTPILLPGESCGWRSLVGCSPWGCNESDMTERLHFHFSLSCTGEGSGNPLQCSCLENPRGCRAWWDAVYGVSQSQRWLKQLSSSSSMSIELVMPSNHLILCRPLFLLPSIFPSIRAFSNESALRIRWPKYWSFSFNICPSSEHLRLISFRMDWLDLLAVQGTPRIFSNITVRKHQLFSAQLSL